MTHGAFLEKLYAEERVDRALDLMYDYIGDLLDDYNLKNLKGLLPISCQNPNFEAVDQLFREADLDRTNTTVMVGFLSVPFVAREHLTEYKPLLERVRAKLSKTESKKRVRALLQGFDR